MDDTRLMKRQEIVTLRGVLIGQGRGGVTTCRSVVLQNRTSPKKEIKE